MQSAVLVNNQDLELQEVSVPTPGPGEVVVKMEGALTNSIDVREYRQSTTFPAPLGHECAGTISAIGANVTKFAVGDAVMMANSAGCGHCSYCQKEQDNYCSDFEANRTRGAFSEYVKVSAPVVAHNMYIKPEHVSFYDAAFLDSLAQIVHGLNSIKIEPEDTVVILGCGSIGLLFLQALRIIGKPRTIIAADKGSDRVAKAKSLGADYVCNIEERPIVDSIKDITDNYGANIVIECAGTEESWSQMMDLASRGSHVLVFGGCPSGADVTVNTGKIHYDQMTIVGSVNYTSADVHQACDLLINKKFSPSVILNNSIPLTELKNSFVLLNNGEAIKYGVFPVSATKE